MIGKLLGRAGAGCLCALALLAAAPAWALPPAIEARVEAAVAELKKDASDVKDACGELILVQGEVTIENAKGVTRGSFPTQIRESWGCNSPPGGVVKNGRKFSGDDEPLADGSVKHTVVDVIREVYYDHKNSAVLQGRVVDKDGNGKGGATVTLVNARSGQSFSAQADAQGDYEIHVPSGEYEATATHESCSATRHKQLCAFGQASGPTAAHGPFHQDFRLDCGDLVARIGGGTVMDMHVQDEGARVDSHGSYTASGEVPLHVDPAGSVSGEGTMQLTFNHDFVGQAVVCDDEGNCQNVNGMINPSYPDQTYRVTAKGRLSGGFADLDLESVTEGTTLNAAVQGPGGTHEIHAATGGASFSAKLHLRWADGEVGHYDSVTPMEGGSTEAHFTYTLGRRGRP